MPPFQQHARCSAPRRRFCLIAATLVLTAMPLTNNTCVQAANDGSARHAHKHRSKGRRVTEGLDAADAEGMGVEDYTSRMLGFIQAHRRDCHLTCSLIRSTVSPHSACKALRRKKASHGATCETGYLNALNHLCTGLCAHANEFEDAGAGSEELEGAFETQAHMIAKSVDQVCAAHASKRLLTSCKTGEYVCAHERNAWSSHPDIELTPSVCAWPWVCNVLQVPRALLGTSSNAFRSSPLARNSQLEIRGHPIYWCVWGDAVSTKCKFAVRAIFAIRVVTTLGMLVFVCVMSGPAQGVPGDAVIGKATEGRGGAGVGGAFPMSQDSGGEAGDLDEQTSAAMLMELVVPFDFDVSEVLSLNATRFGASAEAAVESMDAVVDGVTIGTRVSVELFYGDVQDAVHQFCGAHRALFGPSCSRHVLLATMEYASHKLKQGQGQGQGRERRRKGGANPWEFVGEVVEPAQDLDRPEPEPVTAASTTA